MKTILALACIAGAALAAPVPKELTKDDAARFVGEWWECQNEATLHPDVDKARRFTFETNGALAIRQNTGAAPTDYTIAFEPNTTPRSFVLSNSSGKIYNATYRLDGDTLRFVLTDLSAPLLKEAKYGAGGIYYELKRVK